LADLLREKNIIPAEKKNKLKSTDYKPDEQSLSVHPVVARE
jgi:hypothetical protein